jgi:dihydrolipoamide dehydrogenase
MQELPHSATIVIAREVTLAHTLEPLWHAVPAFPTASEVWPHLLETYGL